MRKFLLRTKIIIASLLVVLAAVASPHAALAVCDDPANSQQVSIGFNGAVQQSDGSYCVPINTGGDINNNPIIIMLKGFVQFLAAGVGLAVVGGIIYGGIVYMTARANPGQIQKAEGIIRSAVIGLLLYIFMFALLNFLIPGGILT